MLSVNHLDIRYGNKHLFRDLSAVVYPGDRIGLVGVNGTGKTTLMKIMAGETATDDSVVTCARHFSVGYLPQEPGVISSNRTVYQEAETSFAAVLDLQRELKELNHRLAGAAPDSEEFEQILERQGEVQHRLEEHDVYTIRTRIEKVLHGLGFRDEDLERPVVSFSGGWVMRLLLARMLLAAPSLLLLDEPTNHLDLDSLTWLESFLQSYDGAMVIISHDRSFLDRTTRQTWELSLGRLTVYKGNYSYYVREKEERRRIEKAAYSNQQAQIRQTMRFVERFKAKATKARQAQSRLKQLDKMEVIELAEDEQQIRFSFPAAPHSGRDVLMIEDVGKSYHGKPVFTDVNLLLQRGDKVAVVGVNGAGKSTLLRILAGQLPADSGQCRLGSGVQLTYFGQHQAQELPPDYTVLETLSHAAEDLTTTRLRSLLGAFLFRGEDVDKKVSVLSGGEKSRLALARMIAIPANCMLLDEPTNHLDMSSQEVLQEAMRQYDGTIVVVSHNRYFLDCFVNKVLEVKDGRVTVYEGTVAEFLDRQQLLEQRQAEREKTEQTAAPTADVSGDSKKERRRREAERRRRRQDLAGPWLKKLSEAERQVDKLEREKEQLEKTLADPDLYQDQQHWSTVSADYEESARRLDRWLLRWEEAQARIDEIDRQLAEER
ncbi:ABC-F family ATP-binding cassette domain-containing protein [Desulfofustis glycolicus]|uniref:ATP-binding cassette, subfamily F, member 3 n=1 Tax=Desulfofustis glycolicus DSM 9705 TaxID=1121409 RepID=A0A1M5XCX8_9BACT|nr:ABC-F family ATP-binding cassette domain-containing protein [Desulfofustis glycolicus]MCB2217897.1 ABC-F family ATP-binding cassette domain-containing protein [Desulfobulbaceae bacterium]SHH97428.1 ATP-binding cassette, subfamily F, member 3 [Desulfofustis glycolicus DSM 9705]